MGIYMSKIVLKRFIYEDSIYQYFRTKGAMFYALSKKYSFFLILQFAIRKYGLYKNETSFFNALKYMRSGKNEYKGLLGE